jgi:hypothetical protein
MKLGFSVVESPIKKKEQSIMKSIEKTAKTVRIIKNLHSNEEMQEKGKRFVAHKQLFLSLDDVLRLESEKQKQTELLIN